ncbi:hypothetical protein MFUM_480025 [Methylacidiphilum fumariolicum SolV]|uniref:Uncharacterized protein n=2 Tax=Candidatus Methylacidiphilum fumarolicum TaxID=591154 RepID=I0JY89_METFB|nr:conserved protein of unknown function [Candidatus Methylacidiphilum fumarolicum]CCG92208.1 hypothetical protein MFUM_480025 [Methylacidiphilum fumariolicum SolV]
MGLNPIAWLSYGMGGLTRRNAYHRNTEADLACADCYSPNFPKTDPMWIDKKFDRSSWICLR